MLTYACITCHGNGGGSRFDPEDPDPAHPPTPSDPRVHRGGTRPGGQSEGRGGGGGPRRPPGPPRPAGVARGGSRAREVRASDVGVGKVLDDLEAYDVVRRRRIGRAYAGQANPDSAPFGLTRGLFERGA